MSRTLGAADRRYDLRRRGAGWVGENPAQRLQVRVAPGGVSVRAAGVSWTLGLRAVGRVGRLQPVSAGVPEASGNTVRLLRPGLAEWYANGPLGLEQGFTLQQPPPGPRLDPATLALDLPSGSAPRLLGPRDLLLGRSLRYTGLAVVDAGGRALPAWLELRGDQVMIRVDDRAARYPVRVDPDVQIAQLSGSDANAQSKLGASVAISADGGVVAVGAPALNGNRGGAYVFVRQTGGWADETQVAELTASDAAAGDTLGQSVAISEDGSTIVAGAPEATISTVTKAGAAYVFVRPGGGWGNGTQTAKLFASDPNPQVELGVSVSVSGNGSSIVAGARGADESGRLHQGAVYVYQRPTTGWATTSQLDELTSNDGAAGDHLGWSVGISADGSTIAAGAPSNGTEGAAYVFTPAINTGFAESAKLTESGGAPGDGLGVSLVVPNGGGSVIVGAPYATVGGQGDAGAAFVFIRHGLLGRWSSTTQSARLTASDPAALDELGSSVGMSDDGSAIIVGAPNVPLDITGPVGKVYEFARPLSGGWTNLTEASEPGTILGPFGGYLLGASVAMSADGTTALAGAPGDGSAFIFARPTATAVVCAPGVVVGHTTSCTATVSDVLGVATPTGSVSFGTDSSGSLSAGGECTLVPIATAGSSACQISYMPRAVGSGTHTISAVYLRDASHYYSGNSAPLAVAKSATATAVTCQPEPTRVRMAAACVATVTDTGGSGLTPSGTVAFTSGGAGTFGSGGACALVPAPAAGSAHCQISYTPSLVGSGTHTVSGAYGGDGNELASDGAAPLGVGKAPSSTVLSCTPLSVAVGHVTTCVATVTHLGPGALTPTGKVTFTTSGLGAFGAGGGCALAPTATPGIASCQTTYTPTLVGTGAHTLTAPYAGDGNHLASVAAALVAATGPPIVSGARQSHTRWRRGGKLATVARATIPVGTTFSFTLNESATVRLAFSASHRRARGTLTLAGHPGTDRVGFQGRLSRSKTLGPGSYTVTITATNRAGQRSPPRTLSFTIVG